MPPEEKDDIEILKAKLYSRARKQKPISDIRMPLTPSDVEAPVTWPLSAEEAESQAKKVEVKKPPLAQFSQSYMKKKMSFASKFFIGSLVFFILAMAAAAYIFFGGGNIISPGNIDLQVVMPSLIDAGKAVPFEIIVGNRNTSAISLVDLVITYPNGTRDPQDSGAALSQVRQTIGTVAPGQQIKQTASGIFYGQEGTQEKVQVALEYSIAGSNAVFEKQAEADFVIGSSPVSVSIDAPSEAIAGQQFPITITVQSNATTPIQNLVMQGQYPFGFSVASTTPQAQTGGTFWQLGTLAPGASAVIHLIGSIDGQDGDQRVFRFIAGSNTDPTDTTIAVPILTVPQTITVRKPFISGVITVNGQGGKDISVSGASPLQGTLTWQNNLPTAVSNVQLTLTLTGPALDKNSVSASNGFYQSQNGTITWSSAQDPELADIPAGGQGSFQFSFASLPAGSGGVLITNPTISLNLAVQGTRQDQNNVPQQVSSAASAQVSIASALSLTSQAFHFSGPFTNSGPMPPQAESDTSYGVVWTVKNSSNTVANAIVSATLPPYVRYVSSPTLGVSYDSASRTVTWSLGDLNAGVGYTAAAKQASFQIVVTPSLSQVGTAPALTSAVSLAGQDRFAQVTLNATADAPTTFLPNDSGFQSGMDLVVSK
ncbi:MAG TPA: hypothetical protein VIJ88_00015 [Candidatus Paceibacterota bacterium]